MRGPTLDQADEEAGAETLELVATSTERRLGTRWNFGPTTDAVLRAVAATPDRARCTAGHLTTDEDDPAISTVSARPPRPFRIAIGPNQLGGPSPGDHHDDETEEYVHPDWCECDALRSYLREELGLDQTCRPDEILPAGARWLPPDPADRDESDPWHRLWRE